MKMENYQLVVHRLNKHSLHYHLWGGGIITLDYILNLILNFNSSVPDLFSLLVVGGDAYLFRQKNCKVSVKCCPQNRFRSPPFADTNSRISKNKTTRRSIDFDEDICKTKQLYEINNFSF